MAARHKEFASVRLTGYLSRELKTLANYEKRTLSQMIRILIEEALTERARAMVRAERAENAREGVTA